MQKVLSVCFVAVTLLAVASCTLLPCTLCPQAIPGDPNPVFCVTNSFGSFYVTHSEFISWNCNHPFNKYVRSSQCQTIPICINSCTQAGPKVCARLSSPVNPLVFTYAEFGNQCQLNLYNCQNPSAVYQLTNYVLGVCQGIM